MAVIGDAIKMWSRSDGTFESPDLLERKARFKDGYSIIHDVETTMREILSAPGLPQLGDQFEDNEHIFCKKLTPKRTLVYTTVDVEYEGEVGPAGIGGSPISDLPVWEFSSVQSTEPVDECVQKTLGTGVGVVTVNDEAVEGVTKEIYDILLTVDRNFLSVNLVQTLQYLDSVNGDAYPNILINPFPAGTGRLRAFKATPMEKPNGAIAYYKVHAEILFRQPYRTSNAHAWWARVRHEGYRVKGDDGEVANAWEDLQMNVNKPILLAADGTKLPTGGTPVWVEYQIYQYIKNYAALGLF